MVSIKVNIPQFFHTTTSYQIIVSCLWPLYSILACPVINDLWCFESKFFVKGVLHNKATPYTTFLCEKNMAAAYFLASLSDNYLKSKCNKFFKIKKQQNLLVS